MQGVKIPTEPMKKGDRIPIPVVCQTGGTVHIGNDGLYVRNVEGSVVWSYQGNDADIDIACCARSGSMYIVRVLDKIGYSIGHEVHGPDGSAGYHLAFAGPKNCLHQVRDPIEQISSTSTLSSWGFVPLVTDIDTQTLLGRMQYWLVWNEMCEKFCSWRYRIEDLPNVWPEFLEMIGHKQVPLPDVPTNVNSRKDFSRYKRVTWADLFNENAKLATKIRDKAEYYGYGPARTSLTTEPQITQVA